MEEQKSVCLQEIQSKRVNLWTNWGEKEYFNMNDTSDWTKNKNLQF